MAEEPDKAFAKWATLLALCRDAVRVLPDGWHEKRACIDTGGKFGEMLIFTVTNGEKLYSLSWPGDVVDWPEERLKHDVAARFVQAQREIVPDRMR